VAARSDDDGRVFDEPISTERLRLVVLDSALLAQLASDPSEVCEFSVPEGWPDADGRAHVERWRRLAEADGGSSPWRARAVVDAHDVFVGHAGFHGPPVPVVDALDDPTFEGTAEPIDATAVEIGYTILAANRRRGYAAEAAAGLMAWAEATGEVGAVIASVRPDNQASLAVLAGLGGFRQIGTCSDGDDDEIVLRRNLR
jgi:RimJ/RimL family protein N-acetyltransferase